MSKVIQPFGNVCTVQLDLPWEMAELIVEEGPGLIAEIAQALKMRKNRTEHNEKFAARQWFDHQHNKRDFYSLGREVERRVRRCLDGKPDPAVSGVLSNSTDVRRREIMKQLAVDYDTSASSLDLYRKMYVKDRNIRLRQRRDAAVIRYHIAGWPKEKIALKIKKSPATVVRILTKNRDVLEAFRRLHPFEFDQGEAHK